MIPFSRSRPLDPIRYFVESAFDDELGRGDVSSLLYNACESGHLGVVTCLVESGADVEMANDQGESPVHIASYNGHIDVVKFLVEAGANKDKGYRDGASPLLIASYNGHLEVVRYLVECGADKVCPKGAVVGMEGARCAHWGLGLCQEPTHALQRHRDLLQGTALGPGFGAKPTPCARGTRTVQTLPLRGQRHAMGCPITRGRPGPCMRTPPPPPGFRR